MCDKGWFERHEDRGVGTNVWHPDWVGVRLRGGLCMIPRDVYYGCESPCMKECMDRHMARERRAARGVWGYFGLESQE